MKKIEKEYNKYSSMSQEQLEEAARYYSTVSPEQLRKYRDDEMVNPLIEELDVLNKQIENMQKNVENINDIDKKADKLKELSAMIKKRDSLFKTKSNNMKDIEKEIQDIQRQAKLIKGYLKNKDKIERVRNYKSILESKKEKFTKENEKLAKEKEKNTSDIINLKNRDVEIQNQLKKSEELDNNQYNELLIEKENINKKINNIKVEIENKEKKIKENEKRLISISQAISKCDLAWKCLFMGNSWDEISIKAANMNKQNKVYKPANEDSKKIIKAGKELGNSLGIQNGTVNNEGKDIIELSSFEQKHPKLAKFFNGLVLVKFVKGLFGMNKIEYKPLVDDKKEKTEVDQRDNFIEELRRHIESNSINKSRVAQNTKQNNPKQNGGQNKTQTPRQNNPKQNGVQNKTQKPRQNNPKQNGGQNKTQKPRQNNPKQNGGQNKTQTPRQNNPKQNGGQNREKNDGKRFRKEYKVTTTQNTQNTSKNNDNNKNNHERNIDGNEK